MHRITNWSLFFSVFVLALLLGNGLTGCKGTGSGGESAAMSSSGDPDPDPAPAPDPGPVTGTATLSWTAPSQNSDGTALSDLSGYYVYYGTRPGVYTVQVDVGKTTQHAVDQLGQGTYYFSVTAYDGNSNESDFSNEVAKSIQ
jgi:hypothetical protein